MSRFIRPKGSPSYKQLERTVERQRVDLKAQASVIAKMWDKMALPINCYNVTIGQYREYQGFLDQADGITFEVRLSRKNDYQIVYHAGPVSVGEAVAVWLETGIVFPT